MNYPALKAEALSGDEEIAGSSARVIDYWSWAYSCIADNTERGIFAEFLVHLAVNEADPVRTNWKSCDVISPDGIKIEVKSSAYLQSWEQEKLSAIQFSISSRQSDVYVFCLHNHTEQESMNILDLSQWTFFVMNTSALNAKAGNQQTITLSRLKALGAIETDYHHLRNTIKESEQFCVNAN